jgi:hypothetical protein
MADKGMSEDAAKSLAGVVRRVTGHDVEVRAEDGSFVVDVRRAVPGDVYTLRDDQDWQWLSKRTHAKR